MKHETSRILVAFAILFLCMGLHASDRQADCPETWTGSDEPGTGPVFMSIRLRLTVDGSRGVFYVTSWQCLGERAAEPEQCRNLFRRDEAVVQGSVTRNNNSFTFRGESVQQTVIFPAAAAQGRYCLDNLEGTVDGDTLHTQHTDGCSDPTTVTFTKRSCT